MDRFFLSRIKLFEICLTIILTVYFQHGYIWSSAENLNPVCNSTECKMLGDVFKKNMMGGGKPCKDFYDYVCHGWEKQNPRPKHLHFWTVDVSLVMRVKTKLKQLLEDTKESNDEKIESAKLLYRTCMARPSIGPLKPNVLWGKMQLAGKWPMLFPKNQAQSITMPWQIDNTYIKLTGESSLFEMKIQMDHKKKLSIVTDVLRLQSPYGMVQRAGGWGNSTELQHYKSFLTKIIRKIVPNSSKIPQKDLDDHLNAVIMFREQLWQISKQSRSEKKKAGTVKTFQRLYNRHMTNNEVAKIDFLEDIRAIYKDKLRITDNSIVKVHEGYFINLAKLLSETPEDIIANHIHLYFAERYLELDSQMSIELKESVVDGPNPTGVVRYLSEKWQRCVESNTMKNAMARMYVKAYFSPVDKLAVEMLVRKTKRALEDQLMRSTWLDQATKRMSIRKLDFMQTAIGYPDNLWEYTDEIELYYPYPLDVEAKYAPSANLIAVSATYLQWPIYSPNVPYVIDYGSTVAMLGHELYHAFDSRGITFAGVEGTYEAWSANMMAKYREKSKCFRKQYQVYREREFRKHDMCLNNTVPDSLDEDIPDAMGLKLAYEGYKVKLRQNSGVCPILPGFEAEGCEKLFFISFANAFCTASTTCSLERLITKHPYNAPRVRVNGAVTNMKEFSDAFNCKPGDPMKAQETCDIWQ